MKFLENRKIAGIVLCVVIVGTILLGGGCDLRRERQREAELYYTGVEKDGLSIYNDLQARCEAGYNLVTIFQRYLPVDAEELSDFTKAINAVETARNPTEAYAANYQLTVETDRIYALLTAQALSEKDEKLAAGQFAEMTSRNQTIGHDDYNERAATFNELLNRFPTNLIAAVNGIAELELYR